MAIVRPPDSSPDTSANPTSNVDKAQTANNKPIFSSKSTECLGKKSPIYDYCEERIQNGCKQCILVCWGKGNRKLAEDVPLINDRLVYRLGQHDPFYMRWSMYRTIAVRHVKVRLPQSPGLKPPFEVFANPVLYNDEISKCEKDLDRYLRDECAKGIDPYSCGIQANGFRHDDDLSGCENLRPRDLDPYCPVTEASMWRRRLDDLQWIPTLIAYYWRFGIENEGYEFFENNGFIPTYEELKLDQYEAATNPLGKTINAFEFVKGWQISHLFWALCSGVVIALGSMAIGTLASQSFSTGLNVGSYALGIEALILGGMTLFSVVVS